MDKNKEFLDNFINYVVYAEGVDEPYIAYDGAKKTLIGFLFLYVINEQLEFANFKNTGDYLKLHSYLSKIFSSGNFDDQRRAQSLRLTGGH